MKRLCLFGMAVASPWLLAMNNACADSSPSPVRSATADDHQAAEPRANRIIHDGKNWTIVPAASIVHMPDRLRHRIDCKPVGNLLSWADFLEINHSWLAPESVGFDEASGLQALASERVAELQESEKIVVAVYDGAPIRERKPNEPIRDMATAATP
jgi:hypothetical protein